MVYAVDIRAKQQLKKDSLARCLMFYTRSHKEQLNKLDAKKLAARGRCPVRTLHIPHEGVTALCSPGVAVELN